jgi:hypothetical protein
MAETLRIEETTVADLRGWRVTAGNLLRDRYQLPDGSWGEGPTIELGLIDPGGAGCGEPTVGAGAELAFAGVRWRVEAVVPGAGPGDTGHVVLRALVAP